jgi:multiple sugar transport system permease protein
MRARQKFSIIPYLYLLPAFAVMTLVVFYPMVYNIVNSTFSGRVFDQAPQFIGLTQYRNLLSDPEFFNALRLTLIWTLGVTALQYTVGLITALLLNQVILSVRFARPMYILPWIVPGVVAAVVFRFMYNYDAGLVNVTLRQLGLEELTRAWVANPNTAMGAAMVLGVWKGFPFYMVMLLAGLQTVPQELFDAAHIDGASGLQTLRYVSLPFLKPVSATSLLLGIIWTANYFDGIYLLTGGGPAQVTTTLPIYIYKTAFSTFDLNRASAASVLLLVMVILLATLYLAISQRREPDNGR